MSIPPSRRCVWCGQEILMSAGYDSYSLAIDVRLSKTNTLKVHRGCFDDFEASYPGWQADRFKEGAPVEIGAGVILKLIEAL